MINTKNNGAINVYSSDKTLLNQYVSAKEAGRGLNISDVSIFKYLKTGRLFKDKYYFSLDLLENTGINKQASSGSTNYRSFTKPVKTYIYNPEQEKLYEFESVSESARKLEIPRTTISTYLDTRKVYKNKYLFYSYSLT